MIARPWPLVVAALVALSCGTPVAGQPETGGESLLAAALAHHDPENAWAAGRFRLTLESRRPDGSIRGTIVEADNGAGIFHATRAIEAGTFEATIGPGEHCDLRLDGSPKIAPETAEEHGLDCDRWRRMRDYYLFMWGLPMKLRDEGTQLGDEVEVEAFDGAPARVLAVTYDPEVGGDTWTFYFDPETARAVGYRFYHDPATNDGEYIVLAGEVEAGGVRFPRTQTWYMNADDELLGTDELVAAERLD